MTTYDELRLDNQLCFPLYAASRMVTRMYQPLLKEIGVTYPQYLILMVLWEAGELSVTEIGARLHLSSNTLTPLLKRMEARALVRRERSAEDERVVRVILTPDGINLKEKAVKIPRQLGSRLLESAELEELITVVSVLKKILASDTEAGVSSEGDDL